MHLDWGRDWSSALRRGSDDELRGWVDLGQAACDEADIVAMRYFRRDLEIARKADETYVTVADREIERLVRERILAAHPDHGLVGEEYGTEAGDRSVRWYVDPIDGTHNYLRGIPIFATLLAVERDGEVQAGVISAPALGSRWFAWRGGGAWALRRDDPEPRRLGVSTIGGLHDAQVCYGSAPEVEAAGHAPGFRSLLGAAWRTRGFGDFWGYTLVAEAAAEAMIEVGLAPWDVAAPLVLIEEAGGRMTGFDGRRSIDSQDWVATNGVLHDQVREVLLGADVADGGYHIDIDAIPDSKRPTATEARGTAPSP
jgi:histidinol-phosphatase